MLNKELTIGVAIPAAIAAYAAMNPAPLVMPVGYELVGRIQAVPLTLFTAANASKSFRHAHAMIAESSIFGFVARGATDILVAIRGTQTLMDWLSDFDLTLQLFNGVHVHQGFALLYNQIKASIDQLLGVAVIPTYVVGHSLGGAIATLCAFDLAHDRQSLLPVMLTTFASPRVGALDFTTPFQQLVTNYNRIVNVGDLVPQIPPPPLYAHVWEEVTVQGGFDFLDWSVAHAMPTYLKGIEAL